MSDYWTFVCVVLENVDTFREKYVTLIFPMKHLSFNFNHIVEEF